MATQINTTNLTIIENGEGSGVFDVFVGKGWENYSRFQRRGRVLAHAAGQTLPNALYDELYKTVMSNGR